MAPITALKSSLGYLPHGYCYAWVPELLWLHVISDLVIAAAYCAISIALLYFAKRRRDVVFRSVFLLFGLFILACAGTHFMGAWTVWYPAYWTDGAIKVITAAVSFGTAILVWPLIPRALEIPSPRQLLELNQHLASEVSERKQAEQRLRMLIDAEPECVKTVGADGTLLDMNRAGLQMIEAESIEEVRGKPIASLVAPQDVERFKAFNQRVLAGESGILEFQIIGLKGGRRWLESHAVPFASRPGAPDAVLAVTRDVTERKLAEEAVRLAATAFETSEAIMITDAAGIVQRVNSGYSAITGYTSDEIVGTPSEFLHPGGEEGKTSPRAILEALKGTDCWKGELTARRKNGDVCPVWLSIKAVRNDEQILTHYVVTFVDISERKRAQQEIEQLAYFDPLTGLPNRRLFLERLNQAIGESCVNGSRCSLLFVDLDRFKHLNDARGHTVGDQLLRKVAERLSEGVGRGGMVARLGGDEFVILLNGLDEEFESACRRTMDVAENLRVILQRPFVLSSGQHYVTASIGTAIYPFDTDSADDLLKAADMAMYEAKASGRNAVRAYASTMQAAAETRLTLERDMHAALERREFRLYLQSQVDGNGRIVGAEALLRWQHPTEGILLPDKFIALAEETGLILPIGEWVFEQVCHENVRLSQAGHRLSLSVNISPRRFQQADFLDRVQRILKRTGANPHDLIFEITEGLLVSDFDDAIAKMSFLERLGIRFSVDDFGTGYSSLAYLKRLPLSELKIAQTFVNDLPDDPSDVALVQTILSMAYHLNLETVAEGVETRAQLEFLKARGCTRFQGYYFSPPLPATEFFEKLA
ncbi:diguanylate cyclase [Methylococcus capsulatus]|jgi:diguanylate cyclase (GGDEF)-like protein/PAS domain S-box-containing protein|uniref:Diguanylate cyclase n=1 Tax=Methylococcus capsulatus TaxID=414 RepID=A0AA35UK37_METCP|nr:EAL domain-containing protein [Methylococcus capsulatus]CAI8877086.1 diguanylate cyclase [Methylococcus capsulatus]